jgi:hypothetical protein
MTLSRTERSENIELALKLMMGELGEYGINQLLFEIDKPPYENIYPTTWQYLEDQYLIERLDTMGARHCELTGPGWLQGLRVIGTIEAPDTREKVGKVMAELKRHVEGREEKEFEYVEVIADEAEVPLGFVYNIIESGYIETVLNRKGAQWYPRAPRRMVEIPVDFGLEPL